MAGLIVQRFGARPWDGDTAATDDDRDRLQRARAAGYRRKSLLAGEGDVFLNYVEMGPGFRVEPHSHDAREVIHIVAGSLTPDGVDEALTAGDSLVVSAGQVYGFRCGDDGVTFIIFRPSDAGIAYR